MPQRGLQILIALVVLAMCRIMHDSIFTSAPAARQRDVVAAATSRPSTEPALDAQPDKRDEWANIFYTPGPGAIDDAPAATTQPSDAIEWREPLVRDSTKLVSDQTPVPPAPSDARPARMAALMMDDTRTIVTPADVLWSSGGSVGTSDSHPSHAPPAAIVVSDFPSPPVLTDPPAIGGPDLPPERIATPPTAGGGDVTPPLGDPPPIPGVGSIPLPEPANLWFASAFLAVPRRLKR